MPGLGTGTNRKPTQARHQMEPQQIAAHYNQIAQHWAAASFPIANGISQHARALQFLAARGNALDIGCGSSGRIIDLLLAHGLTVEGLDISTEMLRLARIKHPGVTFHLADICIWEFPCSYDFITAWDSIWHVPLARQARVLQKICAALKPGGVLIFTSGGVDAPDERTNPSHGQDLYHAALGIPHLLQLIAACDCVCRHLEFDQHPEQHLYLIVQKFGGLPFSAAA